MRMKTVNEVRIQLLSPHTHTHTLLTVNNTTLPFFHMTIHCLVSLKTAVFIDYFQISLPISQFFTSVV